MANAQGIDFKLGPDWETFTDGTLNPCCLTGCSVPEIFAQIADPIDFIIAINIHFGTQLDKSYLEHALLSLHYFQPSDWSTCCHTFSGKWHIDWLQACYADLRFKSISNLKLQSLYDDVFSSIHACLPSDWISAGACMFSCLFLHNPKLVNTLRPGQNGRRFADDVFKCIFLNENVWILHKVSLKFVPEVPIDNIPALVQILAWSLSGDKPLSEPMMVSLLTHICVTRPQWVNFWAMQCQISWLAGFTSLWKMYNFKNKPGWQKNWQICFQWPKLLLNLS